MQVNLYLYPMCSFGNLPPAEVVGPELQALRWIIHKMAEEPSRAFYRRDVRAAHPRRLPPTPL